MKQRKLGANGPRVGAIGLGCMSFAGVFGETDEATSHACLDRAYEMGITFLDTANVYGMGRSEQVLGAWLKKAPRDVVLATKVGIQRDPAAPVNNRPEHIRTEIEGSLARLGVDHVALYYLHRRDPDVPLAEAVGVMGDLITEGKIGGYGLSEVAPSTIRAAHAILPPLAVQSEYSLWSRLPELGVIQTCAELEITFVPFSPLARGVFGESYPDTGQMAEGDLRRDIPRFSAENYPKNKALIDRFKALAHSKPVPVSALAMAWVLQRGAGFVPIPGTRTAAHLMEWARADEISLSDADMAEIEAVLPVGFAHGDRYSYHHMRTIERYC